MKKRISISVILTGGLLLSGCDSLINAHDLENDGGMYKVSIGTEQRYFKFHNGKVTIYNHQKKPIYKNIHYKISNTVSGKTINLNYKSVYFKGSQGSYPEKMSLLVSKHEKDIDDFDGVRQNLELPYTYIIKNQLSKTKIILDDKSLILKINGNKNHDLKVEYNKNGMTTLWSPGVTLESDNNKNWKIKNLNTIEMLKNNGFSNEQVKNFDAMVNDFSKEEKKDYEQQIIQQLTKDLPKESSKELYHQLDDNINRQSDNKQTFQFKRVKSK